MEDIRKGFEHIYSMVDDDLRIELKQLELVVEKKLKDDKEEIEFWKEETLRLETELMMGG